MEESGWVPKPTLMRTTNTDQTRGRRYAVTNASSIWSIAGPVIAAVITGLVALVVLAVNQYQTRQDGRRKDFAEALAAVERYAELPYRIRRRQGSTPEVRERMAEFIHEVQQDLLFHRSWMRIQAPRVAEVYDSLLRVTRKEAGYAITQSWNTTPICRDEDMPLGVGFSFPGMEEERDKFVQAVSYELEFPPLRWTKDYVASLLDRSTDGKSSEQHPHSGSS